MKNPCLRGLTVGAGYAAQIQLAAWAHVEGAEISCLAALDEERCRKLGADHGIQSLFSTMSDALDACEVDFVDIATPPQTHLELVSQAAERGLAILCQKPLAPTMAETTLILEIAEQAGVALVVNENGRFQPWFRLAKQLVDQGSLGQVSRATFTNRSTMSLPMASFGEQAYFSQMPRLVMYEFGVHFIDIARCLFGEPRGIYAHTQHLSPHIVGEDVALIVLDLDELSVVLDFSWAYDRRPVPAATVGWADVIIEGTEGTLTIDRTGLTVLDSESRSQTWNFGNRDKHESWRNMHQHFIDCLSSGDEAETSGAQSRKTMELVFGAYDSANNQRFYTVGRDIDRLAT